MVLRASSLLLLAACATTAAPQRGDTAAPLKLAVVIDDAQIAGDEIASTLAEHLRETGRATTTLPTDGLRVSRSSATRLDQLRRRAGDGLLALVEVSARAVGPSAGRFRWAVAAKLSVATAQGGLRQRALETAALLLRANQDAGDAIAAALPELIDALQALLGERTALSPARRDPGRLLYLAMVDRFDDALPNAPETVDRDDPQAWHGGDLAGLRRRLPQLKAMGVTDLWLTPIFASRQAKFGEYGAFHGYWTQDIMNVEPRFGGLKAAKGLRRDSRAMGLALHLDLVTNHVAWDAPLRHQRPGWFHPDTPITDPQDAVQRERGWVHGLPDLAQEHPAVRRYLIEAATHWSDQLAPDGFRLDALTHVPTDFVRRLAAALPGRQLLGEFYEGRADRLSQRMRATGIHQAFDFPLHFALVESLCGDKPMAELGAALGQDRLYQQPSALLTFLDNHDRPRIASLCGAGEGLDLALSTLFALRGTPTITWGTEAALVGEKEPDNRRDMRFDHRPWARRIAALAAQRRDEPLLAFGATTVVFANRELLLMLRHDGGRAMAVVINRGAKPAKWSDHLPEFLRPVAPRSALGRRVTQQMLPQSPRLEPWLAARRANRALPFTSSAAGAGWVVVGNAPELGAWQPSKAPKLVNGRAEVSLPGDVMVAVKLAQIQGDSVRWSDAPNRYILPADSDGPIALTP